MSYFNIVAQSSESTVVTEYTPKGKRSEGYQSETQLEQEFIRMLQDLGYGYLQIHKEADLIANLRTQLSKVNGYEFTDGEWDRFFKEVLANLLGVIAVGLADEPDGIRQQHMAFCFLRFVFLPLFIFFICDLLHFEIPPLEYYQALTLQPIH